MIREYTYKIAIELDKERWLFIAYENMHEAEGFAYLVKKSRIFITEKLLRYEICVIK